MVYLLVNLGMIPVHAIATVWLFFNLAITEGAGMFDVTAYGVIMNAHNFIVLGVRYVLKKDVRAELSVFVGSSLVVIGWYALVGWWML